MNGHDLLVMLSFYALCAYIGVLWVGQPGRDSRQGQGECKVVHVLN
jgi:hypothetical protein